MGFAPGTAKVSRVATPVTHARSKVRGTLGRPHVPSQRAQAPMRIKVGMMESPDGGTAKIDDNLNKLLNQSYDFNLMPSSSPTISNIDTTIAENGVIGIYLVKGAHCLKIDLTAPTIKLGTASGQLQDSYSTCEMDLSNIPVRKVNVMPSFTH